MQKLFNYSLRAIWLAALVLLIGCDRQQPEYIPNATSQLLELHCQYAYLTQPSTCCLYTGNEPGRKLELLGLLQDAKTHEPVANQAFYLYQPNSCGHTSNNLQTIVFTDSLGRFQVNTIVPGEYTDNTTKQYIRLMIPGATPDTYNIYFDPFTTGSKANNSQTVQLYYLQRGVLVGEARLGIGF